MKQFDDAQPIYLQLRDEIENAILAGMINPEEMVPSIRTLAQQYQLNHQTVSNALNELVEAGLIYKRRGIGFFVHKEARKMLLRNRQDRFVDRELPQTLTRGRMLGIGRNQVLRTVDVVYETKE